MLSDADGLGNHCRQQETTQDQLLKLRQLLVIPLCGDGARPTPTFQGMLFSHKMHPFSKCDLSGWCVDTELKGLK